jgi:polysaccharide export outer membrane protein
MALVVAGCQLAPPAPPAPSYSDTTPQPSSEYVVGPGDKLNIFVWRNPDLTVSVPVRPDGRLSIPLVEDVEGQLKKYVKDPVVTVIGEGFVGPFTRQVRIIGEAATPRAIAYRANMTVLDAMIEVGGLTKYAAGNDTVLVRASNGTQATYSVRLNSLIKDGDVSANVALDPGDILIIPQRLL